MKKITFLLLLLLPLFAISQSKTITIDWSYFTPKAKVNTSSNAKRSVVTTAETLKTETISQKAAIALRISERDGVFTYREKWQENVPVNNGSLKVSNIRYANLTAAETKLINRKKIPSKASFSIHNSTARDKRFASIHATPIVLMNGRLQKITSFTINYRNDTSVGRKRVMPISNSVLATGEWYKFSVEEDGIHRISSSFLSGLGVNISEVNPVNIKVYGMGGHPLSLLNRLNTEFDLPETSIQVVGGEDGSFDSNDYILFYGTNTTGYNYENDTNINPYADTSFYYLTVDGGPGKRIQLMQEPAGNATLQVANYDTEQYFEEDELSPAKVGRRWFGNRFDIENDQTYDFEFTNLDPAETMDVIVKVASKSESNASMAISVNGTSVNPINFASNDDQVIISYDERNQQIPSTPNVSVNLIYNNDNNPSSTGYLDYVRVVGSKLLQAEDGQFNFSKRSLLQESGIGQYQINNASLIQAVWDVTDPYNISFKANADNAGTLSFKSQLGSLKKYVAVHQTDFYTPVQIADRQVPNQNLKGTVFTNESGNFSDVDYVIVTSPFLIQPALRLANHHRNLSGLRVKVVTTDKIYEEFSSGKQDISAIRNFVRYVYENASAPSERLKYVCLFGDTSVDPKDRLPDNNNIVPVFHTLSSRSSVSSFMSDDFFGSVDAASSGTDGSNNSEGTIGTTIAFPLVTEGGEVINVDIDKLDVAVGRILADDVLLANQMVDKIIRYSSNAAYGNWRNNFTLISDDVDATDFGLQVSVDNLGDELAAQKPFVNVKKIHSDAFQQISSAGGDRYPSVNEAIIEDIEVGSLVVNYFGHGGEDGLAKEFIFTQEAGENLNNENKMPLIITVTCEFTKFDNPERITAGEVTFWNPNGGAVALITTTRSIFVSLGEDFNNQLSSDIFGYGTNNVDPPAEALRAAKNAINNNLRRVIFYIGDPAMPLAFPKQRINLTAINGMPIAQNTTVLQALSKVTIAGTVTDDSGGLLTNYNGVLSAKIFDKNVTKTTLGNDGTTDGPSDVDGDGIPGPSDILDFTFNVLGEGIFNGQASVTAGQFEFEFVVPRDIQIPVGNGRVSFYAKKNNTLEDQTGFNLDVQVGGLNADAPADNQGPEIQLFMNDESFVNGGITNASPNLIAKMQDENGMNTASGIGHDMVAILDGDESNPFVLNEFYQAEVDDFTRGTSAFKLRDLEDGLHTITFKAWDVYNNSSTAEIQFVVAGDDVLKLDRVLNYPNPFVSYTEFWFEHNRPSEPLDVQVQIFTVTGKIVKTINQQVMNIGNRSRDIIWDGRDDFGEKIGKGVYVYKITVKSTLTNSQVEKFEKLVIL